MHQRMIFSVFALILGCFLGNVRAFLDFEPKIVHKSFKNSGIVTTQPLWTEREEDYSLCQRIYPDSIFIRDARSRMGQISWDVSTPFGSMDGNIVYCEAETEDGYEGRSGHFAIGPDETVYELQQDGEYSFSPIYDDNYSY